MKKKKLQFVRFGVQILWLGVALLTMTVFAGMPIFRIITTISLLLVGAAVCGWICMFGTIQDIMSSLGKKILKKRYKVPESIHKFLRWFRYILILGIFLPFIAIITEYDGRMMFFQEAFSRGAFSAIGLGIIGFYMILSFFIDRPFCNYLCPQGAMYGVIGLIRFSSIKRNETTCVNCKKCDKVCPMNVKVSKTKYLRDPHCISCMKCTGECPVENTLEYKRFEFKRKSKISGQ